MSENRVSTVRVNGSLERMKLLLRLCDALNDFVKESNLCRDEMSLLARVTSLRTMVEVGRPDAAIEPVLFLELLDGLSLFELCNSSDRMLFDLGGQV